jgi:hypothetical protein
VPSYLGNPLCHEQITCVITELKKKKHWMELTSEPLFLFCMWHTVFINKTNAHILLLQTRLWLTATDTSSVITTKPNTYNLCPFIQCSSSLPNNPTMARPGHSCFTRDSPTKTYSNTCTSISFSSKNRGPVNWENIMNKACYPSVNVLYYYLYYLYS